jgi:CRP/FNR family transcriptional regulator, anaerobic regulatory protein
MTYMDQIREAAARHHGFGHRLFDVPPRLSTTAEPRSFAPDQALYREGEEASGVFVLRSGMVKLVRHLPNGRARILGLHRSRSVLGLGAAGDGAPINWHTALAVGTVECDWYSRAALRWLREHQPQEYADLLENVHDQAKQADFWLCELSTGPIRSRVARLICFLESIDDELPSGELRLLTCQEMGETLGVTPESVSRIVAGLKRDGVLHPIGDRCAAHYRCDTRALEVLAAE